MSKPQPPDHRPEAQPAKAPASATPDPGICPLCGRPNTCAMERERITGEQQDACWCTQVTFDTATLARIPPAAKGQACLCPACACAANP